MDMMGNDPVDEADGAAVQHSPGLRASLEAILLVVDEPVAEVMLAQVLERPREEIARELASLKSEIAESPQHIEKAIRNVQPFAASLMKGIRVMSEKNWPADKKTERK